MERMIKPLSDNVRIDDFAKFERLIQSVALSIFTRTILHCKWTKTFNFNWTETGMVCAGGQLPQRS